MAEPRTKVLFHFDAGPKVRARLKSCADSGLDIVCCPEGENEPFNSQLQNAEVLWHVLQPITADVMARAPRLRLIQKIGVGVNTIDLDAARQRGIAVCNMPGTNSRAVAEASLLLMLSALRSASCLDRRLRDGHWSVDKARQESLGEIGGRTVGFVGFGAIPQILAPILDAMGADVIYTSRAPKPVQYKHCPLPDLLAGSDIVTLHVPLTEDTYRLIDAAALNRMKPGAVLINTARGELVDERALYDALKSRRLAGAGLDVFCDEPVDSANPLLTLDNVTVTPHIAWLTNETFERSIRVAAANSLAMAGHGELQHRVV